MKKAIKWNYKNIETIEYEEYEIPDGSTISKGYNMNEVILCAECGKKMLYGKGYVSRKIQDEIGNGYIVCEKCFNKEWDEEKEQRKRKIVLIRWTEQ